MSDTEAERTADIANALFEILPQLLARVRADLPRVGDDVAPEWQEIIELRATKGQFSLLRVLSGRPHCTMQELAEQLNVAPPAVTAMVKRLLAMGLVDRTRDEQDWRVVQVSLTERGRRVVALYADFWTTKLQRLIAHLTPDEMGQLRVVIPILRHLSEMDA